MNRAETVSRDSLKVFKTKVVQNNVSITWYCTTFFVEVEHLSGKEYLLHNKSLAF